MRSHIDDNTNHAHNSLKGDTITNDTLQEAIDWFKDHDIPLYAVNDNPSQHKWTGSAKIYANIYIDDAALGCPMCRDTAGNLFVDWARVELELMKMGVI